MHNVQAQGRAAGAAAALEADRAGSNATQPSTSAAAAATQPSAMAVQPLRTGTPVAAPPPALAAVGGNGEAAALLPVVKHVVSEEQLELMRILGEVRSARTLLAVVFARGTLADVQQPIQTLLHSAVIPRFARADARTLACALRMSCSDPS